MGLSFLDITSYGPETLKVLGQAFDEVWQDIAGNYDRAATEEKRVRLALIILGLAKSGACELNEIKDAALRIMGGWERPAAFNGWSSSLGRHLH